MTDKEATRLMSTLSDLWPTWGKNIRGELIGNLVRMFGDFTVSDVMAAFRAHWQEEPDAYRPKLKAVLGQLLQARQANRPQRSSYQVEADEIRTHARRKGVNMSAWTDQDVIRSYHYRFGAWQTKCSDGSWPKATVAYEQEKLEPSDDDHERILAGIESSRTRAAARSHGYD